MQTRAAQEGPWITCAAALPAELAGLRRAMTEKVKHTELGVTWHQGLYAGQPLLLLQTGMGRDAAERAIRLILDRYALAAMVSFGFAGGLSNRIQAGDLVLCRELYLPGDIEGQATLCSDAGLLALAQKQRIGGKAPSIAGCLTVDRVVSQPQEKMALGKAYPVEILEMESYWIGQACAQRSIPFLAVRAVSDSAGQNIPAIERLTSPNGEVRRGAAFRYFLRHPASLIGVAQLVRDARLAGQHLTAFLLAFLQSYRVK